MERSFLWTQRKLISVQRFVLVEEASVAERAQGKEDRDGHCSHAKIERDARDEGDKLAGRCDSDTNVPIGNVPWRLEGPGSCIVRSELGSGQCGTTQEILTTR